MNDILDQIENNGKVAEAVGKRIIKTLGLRKSPDYADRWTTTIGSKTAIGIARVTARILWEEAEAQNKMFQVCFTHRHGVNTAVVVSREEPSVEEACKALNWNYNREDDFEYVDISSVEIVII